MAGQGANGLVAWAVEAGVAKGTSATTFAPNARLQTEHIYDLSRQNYYIGGVDFTEKFVYNNNDGSLSQMTTANGDILTYEYDEIKRNPISYFNGIRWDFTWEQGRFDGSQAIQIYYGYTLAQYYEN